MPSFERGVYEPKSDDIRVFDEDEQDIDDEGSRLPLLIVIALLVLAAFGGVVWLAYNQGVQRGRSDAPRMIVAAPGPVKEAAANNPDTIHNLKIYQQPAPSDDETVGGETISPSVSGSTAPPPVESAKSAPLLVTAKPQVAKPAPAKVVKQQISKAAMTETKPAKIKPTESKSTTVKSIETAALPPVAGAKNTPVAAKPLPAAETTSTTGGAYMLQIGAYKSQEEADAAWKTFKTKHPVAGSYSEDVRRADLGGKGIWYRLRMGSFVDKSAAAAFCEKLKAEGGSCLIAK